MNLSIDKSTLLNVVNVASTAVTKSTMPIMECVLLEVEDGKLRVTGSSHEITIVTSTEATVDSEGAAAVNAKLLTDMVKRMPHAEVDIKQKDNALILSAGAIYYEIAIVAGTYPRGKKITSTESLRVGCNEFRELVAAVSFAIDGKSDKEIMRGMLFEATGGVLTAVACRGTMLALHKVDNSAKTSIVIPGKHISLLHKLLDKGEATICAGPGQILVQTGDTQITLGQIEGEFLDYKKVIPSEPATITVNTKNLQSAVDRAELIFNTGEILNIRTPTSVMVIGDTLKISMVSKLGSVDETLPCDNTGKDITAHFNPRELLECLKHIDDSKVKIAISETMPCVITPEAGDKFLYLVVPVRTRKGA